MRHFPEEETKMAAPVKFVSQTQINAQKELKRKAREQILQKAKDDYEREERRKEKRKATGEDTWMLPSVDARITGDNDGKTKSSKKRKHKKEKRNKDKKSKKHKKKDKKEKGGNGDVEMESSESESEEEWVVRGSEEMEDDKMAQTTAPPVQRDSWMLLPTFSSSSKRSQPEREPDKTEEEKEEERIKKLSCLDMPGQHSKELNPYWKEGGTGLPSERKPSEAATTSTVTYDLGFLKKALHRSKTQAEEEGRPLEEVVEDRWGSLKRLQGLIQEAKERSPWEDRGRSSRWMKDRSTHRDEKCSPDRNRNPERERIRHDRYRDRHDERPDKDDKDKYERHLERGRRDDQENDVDRGGRDNRESRHVERGRRDDQERHRNKDRDVRIKERREDTGRREQEKTSSSSRRSMFMKPGDDDSTSRSSSSFGAKFMRPTASIASSSNSTRDATPTTEERRPMPPAGSGRSSGGWRKTAGKDTEPIKEKQKLETQSKEIASSESSSESGSGSEEEEVVEKVQHAEEKKEETQKQVPKKKITEADLNSMGAKILRAELMGDKEQAAKLNSELEQMRQDKEAQEVAPEHSQKGRREEEVVVLTRTDSRGNTRPVEMSSGDESKGGRCKKKQKVATHGGKGDRERYFADDDRYSLQDMVRMEKMNTAEDYNSMFSRLSSGAHKTDSDNFTLDDHFVSAAATKLTPAQAEEREKRKAIAEHKRQSEQLSKCRFCFENPDLKKHLIIAIGIQVYLAVPLHQSLTEGHCLIIPMQHVIASTLIDEDVYDEIKIYKKGLTRMFQEMDKDVVFLESFRDMRRQHHMIVECIPIPKEDGDMAPIYFKKAIMESDVEWAQNKRLIDTRERGLRNSIPRGLPYFNAEFGLDGGFAHVIEDEALFPHYFGKEIIGGMLDLEPRRWRKPRVENFEEHKKKVLQFSDWWKPYDWTKRIDKAKQN